MASRPSVVRLRPAAVVVWPRVDEGHLVGLLLRPRRAAARECERGHPEREHEPGYYELLLICSSCPACRLTRRLYDSAARITLPSMEGLQRRIAVARGDEPADLVVRGGRVLSVFTREWLDADIAVVDGVVAGVGRYEGDETLDATGRYVVPGFIDAHMHFETREADGRRIRTIGSSTRHDRRRRRPARDRERPRRGRSALAARRLGRTAARRLLHGVVVRARFALRIAPATVRGR